MSTVALLKRPAREVTCNKCGNSRVNPDFSENFVEDQLVINFWSCKSCGNRFETEVFMPVAAKSKVDSEAAQKPRRTLLVA